MIAPLLVENDHEGKWRGRTPENKLVFFEDTSKDWRGQVAQVKIDWAGQWSMQGRLAGPTCVGNPPTPFD